MQVAFHDDVFIGLDLSFTIWVASGEVRKNLCLYSLMGACLVVIWIKQAHSELVNPMIGSYELPWVYISLMTLCFSSSKLRK